MATQSIYPTTKDDPPVEYPTGDGKPMAETPLHRDNMIAMLDVLRARFAPDPMVYISGNMFLYYVPGEKRAMFPRRLPGPRHSQQRPGRVLRVGRGEGA